MYKRNFKKFLYLSADSVFSNCILSMGSLYDIVKSQSDNLNPDTSAPFKGGVLNGDILYRMGVMLPLIYLIARNIFKENVLNAAT